MVYIFNWLKGISGQRHFDRKKFRFWITGLIGTKHTIKGTSKSLPRSEDIPIFVSSYIFNTSCQISINAVYQSLHVNFIIIYSGCANGTTTQRFPDSLQWPMAELSWAQNAQCTGFSYVMVHSNYTWWIPPLQWQAICFPLTKHRKNNLCDVVRILEHDGYKSMLCQEKTVKLIPKGVV